MAQCRATRLDDFLLSVKEVCDLHGCQLGFLPSIDTISMTL